MPNVFRPERVVSRPAALAMAICVWLAGAGTNAQQSPAQPQQQPATPVFRGGVEFVSVDVFPRRDGDLVAGLRAEDFQVLEDGTPQRIESFEFVRIEPNPLDSERRDPTSQADGDQQAADPRNRVFVIYLDLTNTTVAGGHQARQPLVDFLQRTIGARDLFTVTTPLTAAGHLTFGRRIETIEDQLERHWIWGRSDRVQILPSPESPYEERLLDCVDYVDPKELAQLPYPGEAKDKLLPLARLLVTLHRNEQQMSSLDTLMRRLGALRDERKNVLFVSEGWVPQEPRDELRNLVYGSKERQGEYPSVWGKPGGTFGTVATNPYAGVDLAWCEAETRRLALIDFEARFRNLLTAANEANVSFYPIDVGGLRSAAPLGGAIDTLRTMAESTDGFAVVGTNDLTGAVRRIEHDLSAYYLLGYYSTNPTPNGRFRKIEVKVKDPGVRISARRGYFALTPEMAAAAAAPRAEAGPSAVDEATGRLASIRPDAALFLAGAAGPDGLDIAIEVTADAVRREGWTQGTTVQVTATGADGRSATTTAALAAGERNARVALRTDEVGTGPWRVVARATGRDRTVEERLDISAPVAQLVGQPVAYRATPSPRSPLRPLADARLSRLERLRVEWPIVGQADAHTARLLDRTGKPLGQPLPFATLPPDRRAVAVDLPIGPLSEGDYVLELVATQGAVTERRLLAFRVIR
ncbi:MAG: VWA domain-containing protein [Acidobacteria bacterium]|nr:VWA domain-containing protein [Acidobacteriota bacterium]